MPSTCCSRESCRISLASPSASRGTLSNYKKTNPMLNTLATGSLIRPPKTGTTATGTTWANTTLRCSTGTDKDGAALAAFVNVVAFGTIADELARLAQGDAVSVQGPLKQSEYTAKDGTTRHGLEILANGLLTPYQIKKRRGADQPPTKPAAHRQEVDFDDEISF